MSDRDSVVLISFVMLTDGFEGALRTKITLRSCYLIFLSVQSEHRISSIYV